MVVSSKMLSEAVAWVPPGWKVKVVEVRLKSDPAEAVVSDGLRTSGAKVIETGEGPGRGLFKVA